MNRDTKIQTIEFNGRTYLDQQDLVLWLRTLEADVPAKLTIRQVTNLIADLKDKS